MNKLCLKCFPSFSPLMRSNCFSKLCHTQEYLRKQEKYTKRVLLSISTYNLFPYVFPYVLTYVLIYILKYVLQYADIQDIQVIPSGNDPPQSSELSRKKRMAQNTKRSSQANLSGLSWATLVLVVVEAEF